MQEIKILRSENPRPLYGDAWNSVYTFRYPVARSSSHPEESYSFCGFRMLIVRFYEK